MTDTPISDKALEAAARAILENVPQGYGMRADEAQAYAKAAIDAYERALWKGPESFREEGVPILCAHADGSVEVGYYAPTDPSEPDSRETWCESGREPPILCRALPKPPM